MNILLAPIGSHGDVHPFVGIGQVLRSRGHRVRVIVNPFFTPLVQSAGLEVIPIGTAEEYTKTAADPRLWGARTGPRRVFSLIGDFIRPTYDAIAASHEPGNTVVVASTLALGARVAQDRHCIPTATVHLQPVIFRSYTDPPKLHGILLGKNVPQWFMRLQWAIADRFIIDPMAGKALNAVRKEVGLPPVKGILRQYIHSPDRVLGLFPGWYAPPQEDWPPQTRLTGFPLYDERDVMGLSPELESFLDGGSAPIAFTFGSAMWHAHELLEQSARACTLLGRRGILLTRHREQVPQRLPAGVRHVDFAPFSRLLPRCAAIVHHGGIGTASQGLAAGIPHLVLPHAHDQHDNAHRLQQMGVGQTLQVGRYKADHVAQALGDLIGSKKVAQAAAEISARFTADDSLSKTCDWIEQLKGAAERS